jgi:hypothetical protein
MESPCLTPIGDRAMTPAERQQRRRDKLKALRNDAPQPLDPVLDFLTQRPDAVAARICSRISPEMARDIAIALRRRLWLTGTCADWQPSPRATPGARLGWMAG